MKRQNAHPIILLGYLVATFAIGAGSYLVFLAGTGESVGEIRGIRLIVTGLLVLYLAPAATSFATGYVRLGRPIALSELPIGVYRLEGRAPELGIVLVREAKRMRLYVVAVGGDDRLLPESFSHRGGGKTAG